MDEIVQIRSAFVNFIGAFINASIDDPRVIKHKVSSILLEETLKLSKDENDIYDFYILKPLFRAVIVVFQNKISVIDKDIKELPDELSSELKKKRSDYLSLIQMMNNLIEDLNKNGGLK